MISEKKYDKEILKAFINKQIYRCVTNEYYIFGIHVSKTDKIKYIDTIIETVLNSEYDKYIKVYKKLPFGIIVGFTNGSKVDVMVSMENYRGKRYHAIAIDMEINQEIKECICYPKFIPYLPENPINDYRLDILEFKINQ